MNALSAASLVLLAFTLGVGLALFSLPYASGQRQAAGLSFAACAVTAPGCG
jgi:hypothetical protein